MSEHLPECTLSYRCHGFTGIAGSHVMKMDFCTACRRVCICTELRACEQRVLGAIDLTAANVQYHQGEAMTNHRPECPSVDAKWKRAEAPLYGLLCICDRLEECEQRVRLEDDDYAYVVAQAEADGRRQGWDDALDTAQEAIAALDKVGQGQYYVLGVFDSLSAIETLKHNTSS